MECEDCGGEIGSGLHQLSCIVPADLKAENAKLRAERDAALGRAADETRRADTAEETWRETVMKAREARDSADLQVKKGSDQIDGLLFAAEEAAKKERELLLQLHEERLNHKGTAELLCLEKVKSNDAERLNCEYRKALEKIKDRIIEEGPGEVYGIACAALSIGDVTVKPKHECCGECNWSHEPHDCKCHPKPKCDCLCHSVNANSGGCSACGKHETTYIEKRQVLLPDGSCACRMVDDVLHPCNVHAIKRNNENDQKSV